MQYQNLKWQQDGHVGILTLSRPQALNALNTELLKELDHFFSNPPQDLRALIVTGDGEKSFVAGADIKEMRELNADAARAMAKRGQAIFNKIQNSPYAVIAAVNGFALGGGLELALSCDFIVASRKARFGLPEVGLGLIPGYGGTQRLSRVVGQGVAQLMTLTGDMYGADQAERWGLAALVVEPEALMETAKKLASTISQKGPLAVSWARQVVREGWDLDLTRGLDLEAETFSRTFTTSDRNEGVSAFVEKRAPQFTGK